MVDANGTNIVTNTALGCLMTRRQKDPLGSRVGHPGGGAGWLPQRYLDEASRRCREGPEHSAETGENAGEQAMGWEALEQWGDDVARLEPLAGGVGVNQVWRVRVNGHLAVGRLGHRRDGDLAWETDLLRHLDRQGMTVPVPIPTTDGRLFAAGLVVMTFVAGEPPETEADWQRVADTLHQLHRLTHGWPQRPGWRSSTDLLHVETGTRVDLGAMPPEAVVRCRAAWARLIGRTTCVVHGDPNPGNIRMTADRVALIDWDESHVDVPDLDLALPHNAAGLADAAYDIATQARAAWEAAVCCDPSGTDPFALKRLVEVRAV
jgi:Ser/Thr protein kinase RdoA (MazF antagonist)